MPAHFWKQGSFFEERKIDTDNDAELVFLVIAVGFAIVIEKSAVGLVTENVRYRNRTYGSQN